MTPFLEPSRDLVCERPREAVADEQMRTVGSEAGDLVGVMRGHLLDAAERPCPPVEPDRLHAVGRLIGLEALDELAEIEQLAVMAVQEEERRLRSGRSQR